MDAQLQSILEFWFGGSSDKLEELERRNRMWFKPDPGVDGEIRTRFSSLLNNAPALMDSERAAQPRSRLALIILFDQFPRNIFRGTAKAFAFDAQALELCVGGVDAGLDCALSDVERVFFYMPLQHAESLELQNRSVALFEELALKAPAGQRDFFLSSLKFARQHRDLIARFGRFPHRNRVLGRTPTAEESAYLDSGGATYGQSG